MNDNDFKSEVLRSLGRIEQKVDGHIVESAAVHTRHEAAIGTLYSKANEAERFQARTKGVVKGASLVSTVIAGGIGLWLRIKGHI